jgi:hypothetical protein
MAGQSGQYALPFKSAAVAIIFCVLLGPIGLLYASFWGGVIMSVVGIVVISNKFLFPILLCWMICCIWGVRAVEIYNRTLLRASHEKTAVTE